MIPYFINKKRKKKLKKVLKHIGLGSIKARHEINTNKYTKKFDYYLVIPTWTKLPGSNSFLTTKEPSFIMIETDKDGFIIKNKVLYGEGEYEPYGLFLDYDKLDEEVLKQYFSSDKETAKLGCMLFLKRHILGELEQVQQENN